jgi:hypothetical protein
MFYMLCIRKMEAVSYLQIERNCTISRMCVCSDNFGRKIRALVCLFELCQKDGNCITPTIYLCSRFCVSEKGKQHQTYSMFMISILCIRKSETVSYLQYVYALDSVYQKQGTIIAIICLCSRLCVSEREKLYYTYSMFMV